MHTFFITPGELKSVGLEVTIKSLGAMRTTTHRFIIWSQKDYCQKYFPQITDFYDSVNSVPKEPGVYFLNSKLTPVNWFKESVQICKQQPEDYGVITGPLEKKSFNDLKSLGHTEYLRDLFPELNIFMTFFGDLYNCLLLTDHCSLKEVPGRLHKDLLVNSFKAALRLKEKLKFDKPIMLLGLNPHAGEGGLLGEEELILHQNLVKDFDIQGPTSSDGFFGPKAYEKYSLLIANYHDQGLIPFKALNGFSAAQASIGIPFIRTSVDHGTGEDIFNKDKANPESMMKAIKLAEELL